MPEPSLAEDRLLHVSSTFQIGLAEQLDQYAQSLERGDESAAERMLDANPELQQSFGKHIESLQLLCRATHAASRRLAEPQVSDPKALDPKALGTQASEPSTAPPFSMLGDYQIHGEIGRGGMGVVYEATQLSLRRSVALKVLPFAAVLDQQQVARFRNEAQAAASLHHPHIVPVYAVGCERGVHYYSMQLINGNTLEHTLSEMMSSDAGQRRADLLSQMRRDNARRKIGNTTTLVPPSPPLTSQPAVERSVLPRSTQPANQSPPADSGRPSERGVEMKRAQDKSTKIAIKGNGSTLKSIRDRDSIHSLVEVFVNVADALDYAHQQGVIHRDIKPSNLLVDSSGKVWIADFGLARCRSVGNLTAEGSAMGTARYMSPEQIAARPQEVDHRTDIYSLGITLYELLVLQPAFLGSCRETLMRSVETEEPVSPRRLNAAIPIDLETIVLKAISKAKDQRYATAGDLAEDLRRFLKGLPALARRPSKVDLMFRWAMRHRRTVLVSIATVALLTIGVTVSAVAVAYQSHQKDLAMHQARLHLGQANAVVDRFGGLMSDRLESIQGGDDLRSELLNEAQAYYTDFIRYAADDTELSGELAKVQFLLAAVEAKRGNFREAETAYGAAIATFRKLQSSDRDGLQVRSELALCFHNLASLYKQRGRYKDAIVAYEQATMLQDPMIAKATASSGLVSQWGATQTNFGKLLWEYGETAAALEKLQHAEAVLVNFVERSPTDAPLRQQLIECRNSLANAILESDSTAAEQLLQRNISELQQYCSVASASAESNSLASLSSECQLAIAQTNLASILARNNHVEQARELIVKAIEVFEIASRSNPSELSIRQQLAIAHNNLGQILWNQNSFDEAQDEFLKADSIFRELRELSSDDPELFSRSAGALHNLGVVHQHQKRFDQALRGLSEAMELQAMAVRAAPLNRIFRQYLSQHNELLEQVLQELDRSPDSSAAPTIKDANRSRSAPRKPPSDAKEKVHAQS